MIQSFYCRKFNYMIVSATKHIVIKLVNWVKFPHYLINDGINQYLEFVVPPGVSVSGGYIWTLPVEGEIMPVEALVVRVPIALAGTVPAIVGPHTPPVLANQTGIAETSRGTLGGGLEKVRARRLECIAWFFACGVAVKVAFVFGTILIWKQINCTKFNFFSTSSLFIVETSYLITIIR